MERGRTKPRSTFRVLGGLFLALVVALFLLVSCVRLYIGSAPKPALTIPRTELLTDVPKFYPLTALGASGTQTHGVWVTLRRDGSATAFLSKDPRSGCFVAWHDQLTQYNNVYRDPCDGSTYSLEGAGLFGPAPRGLDRYHIDLTEKTVTVQLGRPIAGPARVVVGTSGTPTPAH